MLSGDLYRNITKLVQKGVPEEAIARLRGLPFLTTSEELEEFKTYCAKSSSKPLRGKCSLILRTLQKLSLIHSLDWYADKKSWFWAAVNMHISKMSREDWMSTPNTTNINESAHVLTNLNTGTRLTLLEAIEWYSTISRSDDC